MKIFLKNKLFQLIILAVSLNACGAKPEDELQKAADFLVAEDYTQALQEYRSIAHKYSAPDVKAEALFWAANINLMYLNNIQLAVKEFEAFVLDYPQHPLAKKAYWKIASAYRDSFKDQRRAILKYQELINHFPSSLEAAEAQLAIATCYAELNDKNQAIIEAMQVLKKYPESGKVPDALFFLADIQFIKGDYQKAKENYQRLIRDYPKHELYIQAWFGLAKAQEELHDNKDALKSYQKIKDKHPNRELIARRIERLKEIIKQESKKKKMKW